jgi:hypothetical protein
MLVYLLLGPDIRLTALASAPGCCNQLLQIKTVLLGIKNILAAIATQDDMIESARIINAGFTSHT